MKKALFLYTFFIFLGFDPAANAQIPVKDTSTSTPTFTLEGGATEESITVNNVARSYILFVPPGISPSMKYPMVFFFHGNTGISDFYRNQWISMPQFKGMAEQEKFILVVPQGSFSGTYGWQDGEENLLFFDALLEKLQSQYPIDKDRIYASGMSSGAIFSFRLACQRSSVLAAAVPFSGSFRLQSEDSTEKFNCPMTDLPVAIRAYNGNRDLTVSYETILNTFGVWATAINHCDSNGVTDEVDASLFPGTPPWTLRRWKNCTNDADMEFVTMTDLGHNWTDFASPDVWNFMKEHPKQCNFVVERDDTCAEFYQQRLGKSLEYLQRCGLKQVERFKEVLQITTLTQWQQFLQACKTK